MTTDRPDLLGKDRQQFQGPTPLDGAVRDSDASEKPDEARMNKWS